MPKVARKFTRGNGLIESKTDPLLLNDNYGNALSFSARGYPVHPADDQHSALDATTDYETITAWWRENPQSKCTLPLGAQYGLIAINFNDAFMKLAIEANIERKHVVDVIKTGCSCGGCTYLADDDYLNTWRVDCTSERYRESGAAFGEWLDNAKDRSKLPESFQHTIQKTITRPTFSFAFPSRIAD